MSVPVITVLILSLFKLFWMFRFRWLLSCRSPYHLFSRACQYRFPFVNWIFIWTLDVQDALDGPSYPMFSGLCYYAHNDVPCVPRHPVTADTKAHPHNNHHHCHNCWNKLHISTIWDQIEQTIGMSGALPWPLLGFPLHPHSIQSRLLDLIEMALYWILDSIAVWLDLICHVFKHLFCHLSPPSFDYYASLLGSCNSRCQICCKFNRP